jgi:hypothetical protein
MLNSPFRPGGIQPPPGGDATATFRRLTDDRCAFASRRKNAEKSCCYGNMLPFHEQTDFEFMPQISRYSDEHVEQLLSELTNVLETHKAPLTFH